MGSGRENSQSSSARFVEMNEDDRHFPCSTRQFFTASGSFGREVLADRPDRIEPLNHRPEDERDMASIRRFLRRGLLRRFDRTDGIDGRSFPFQADTRVTT
jgi:hypothetical protein